MDYGKLFLQKSDIGLIVVISDLFNVLLVFMLLYFISKNQEVVNVDVNGSQVSASDFTVEIRGLPKDP